MRAPTATEVILDTEATEYDPSVCVDSRVRKALIYLGNRVEQKQAGEIAELRLAVISLNEQVAGLRDELRVAREGWRRDSRNPDLRLVEAEEAP